MSKVKLSHVVTARCVFGLIVSCAIEAGASALPLDPNNAALLYYQAFLLRPEADYAAKELVYGTRMEKFNDLLRGGKLEFPTDTEEHIREIQEQLNDPNKVPPELREMPSDWPHEAYLRSVLDDLNSRLEHEQKMRGIDPNKTIRDYMGKCREAIELAQAASERTKCDWGFRYSRGFGLGGPPLTEIRNLAMLLRSDALLLAVDGQYQTAFERCLLIRRLAQHIGSESCLHHSVSQSIDYQGVRCIQLLLGNVKTDVETLSWLRNRVVAEGQRRASPRKVLNTEFELALQSLRINTDMLENARQAMRKKEEIIRLVNGQSAQTVGDPNNVETLTDEELIALAANPYSAFLDSALQVMDSEMPYEQKSAEIQSLTKKINDEFGQDPASIPKIAAHPEMMLTFSIVMFCADQVPSIYNLHVQHTAHFNALMAGIEVYLARARTGRLPEELPPGLPKDPFSGKDFAYKITDDGFELSFPDKNVPKSNYRPCEFKVHK